MKPWRELRPPPEETGDASPNRSRLDARLEDCEAGWLPAASGGVVTAELPVSGRRPSDKYSSLECASAGALKPRVCRRRPRSDALGMDATRGTLERAICSVRVDEAL